MNLLLEPLEIAPVAVLPLLEGLLGEGVGADPVVHRFVILDGPLGPPWDVEVRARVVCEDLPAGEGEQVCGPVRGRQVVVLVLQGMHDLVAEGLVRGQLLSIDDHACERVIGRQGDQVRIMHEPDGTAVELGEVFEDLKDPAQCLLRGAYVVDRHPGRSSIPMGPSTISTLGPGGSVAFW